MKFIRRRVAKEEAMKGERDGAPRLLQCEWRDEKEEEG